MSRAGKANASFNCDMDSLERAWALLSSRPNIRSANRCFFHAALPGSAANNDNWARRKSNTALMMGLPSLQVGAKHREKGGSLPEQGYPVEDYSDHGGAVPVVVAGVGMVAVATVSGLPQLEDHRLVVAGIRALVSEL